MRPGGCPCIAQHCCPGGSRSWALQEGCDRESSPQTSTAQTARHNSRSLSVSEAYLPVWQLQPQAPASGVPAVGSVLCALRTRGPRMPSSCSPSPSLQLTGISRRATDNASLEPQFLQLQPWGRLSIACQWWPLGLGLAVP